MKYGKRTLITALAAAALLTATAAGSAAFARGPGTSNVPSHQSDPSLSPAPSQTHKAEPTRAPKATPTIDCSKVPTATPSPAATNEPAGAAKTAKDQGMLGRDWAQFCSLEAARKLGAARADGLLRQLQALNAAVAKSGLSDAEKATLKAEIDAAVAQITALKATNDGAATLEAAQIAAAQIKAAGKLVHAISLHVQTILGSQRVLAAADQLDARIATLQAQILAAPSGIDTAAAQKHLDAMKAAVARARTLAGPLKDQLLALTPDQVKAGLADPTLAAATRALRKANSQLRQAQLEARVVTWILAGKPGFQGHHPKPSASPVPTPVPTA